MTNIAVLKKAVALSEADPIAAKMLLELDKATTAREIQEILDSYSFHESGDI